MRKQWNNRAEMKWHKIVRWTGNQQSQKTVLFWLSWFGLLAVQGLRLKASCLLGRHFTTWATPLSFSFSYFYFFRKSLVIFAKIYHGMLSSLSSWIIGMSNLAWPSRPYSDPSMKRTHSYLCKIKYKRKRKQIITNSEMEEDIVNNSREVKLLTKTKQYEITSCKIV
jgi:hypothetical protein